MSFVFYLVLLSACVVYFLLYSEASRVLKAVSIIVLLHGYITVYSTFEDIRGYPTVADLPTDAQIIWGRVIEPVSSSSDNGYIELWITYHSTATEEFFAFFSLADKKYISRIYRIPYTKENHKFVVRVQEQLKKGFHVGLNFGDNDIQDLQEAEQRYGVEYEVQRIQK